LVSRQRRNPTSDPVNALREILRTNGSLAAFRKTQREKLGMARGSRVLPRHNSDGTFRLELLHQHRLFDVLTAQLVMAIAKAATIGLCAKCGRPYSLKRRSSFCPRKNCQKAYAADRAKDPANAANWPDAAEGVPCRDFLRRPAFRMAPNASGANSQNSAVSNLFFTL